MPTKTSESSFRRTMVATFNEEHGVSAYPMEVLSCPGFPDIQADDLGRCVYVETKVHPIGPRYTVKNLFTRAQLPWYVRHLMRNRDSCTWLVIKRGNQEIYVTRLTLELVLDIQNNLTFGNLPATMVTTTKEAVREILGK